MVVRIEDVEIMAIQTNQARNEYEKILLLTLNKELIELVRKQKKFLNEYERYINLVPGVNYKSDAKTQKLINRYELQKSKFEEKYYGFRSPLYSVYRKFKIENKDLFNRIMIYYFKHKERPALDQINGKSLEPMRNYTFYFDETVPQIKITMNLNITKRELRELENAIMKIKTAFEIKKNDSTHENLLRDLNAYEYIKYNKMSLKTYFLQDKKYTFESEASIRKAVERINSMYVDVIRRIEMEPQESLSRLYDKRT